MVVVSGPTGCGKSMGIRECLLACRLGVYELDGVECDTTEELLQKVKNVRRVKASAEETVIVLDDIESFTKEARTEVCKLIESTQTKGQSPVIITCTQFKHPDNKPIQGFLHIPLRAPCAQAVNEFVMTVKRVIRRGMVDRAQSQLGHSRDVRRVMKQVEWNSIMAVHQDDEKGRGKTRSKRFGTTFEATRSLLKGECTPDEWTESSEARDVTLLQHHLTAYASLDAAVQCLADFSDVDAMLPSRFETCSLNFGPVMQAAARSVHLRIRARDVGALPPPRFP